MSEAAEFLTTLYGDPRERGLWLNIWEASRSTSYWTQSVEQAAEYALTKGEWADVYFGVALNSKDKGTRQRTTNEDAAAIPGLWADIDVAGPGHIDTRKVYPPSKDAVLSLLTELPLRPNLVVDSGGGVHAYWLFSELWVFENDDERRSAYTLSRRWQATIRAKMRAHGWDLDGTLDLARILRVPGTINHKHEGKPVVDVIMELTDRWEARDFDQYLVEDDGNDRSEHVAAGIVYHPGTSPPARKFGALLENSKEFKRVWDRKKEYPSASERDMALISHTHAAGWTEQEIADLITYNREFYDDPAKANMQSYLQLSIGKVFSDQATSEAVREAEENAAVLIKDEDASNNDRLGTFNARFAPSGLPPVLSVARIHPSYNGRNTGKTFYRLTFEDAEVNGESNVIRQYKDFSAAIWDKYGLSLPKMQASEWSTWAQLLWQCAVDLDTGDESSEIGEFRAFLMEYIEASVTANREGDTRVARMKQPFTKDGAVCIFAAHFQEYLATHYARLSRSQMGSRLRQLHATNEVVRIDSASYRVWILDGSEK